jgi:hypothetical protein
MTQEHQMKRVPTPAKLTASLMHPATGTRYDEPLYVSPSGRKFYPIGGAAEETEEEKAAREEQEETDRKAAEDKTFTQAELNRISAREKREGKSSGQLELAKELGFETVEAMKAAAQKQREAEEAAQTEAEKREKAIADRERKAEEREQAAAKRERVVQLKDALRDAGANKADIEDALVLLSTRVKDDDDEDAIVEAVTALKERRKDMFDGELEDETKRGPRGRQPLPTKPTKPKAPAGAAYGAGGLDMARRRGHIKADS